ncbi:MAG: CtsR family transcriptional regulator [Clostridiales bacterium]|nr:CtsR family transcriptional regulator [Clostridiales bacterium]
MNISNSITQLIMSMLEGNDYTDIQRNELAESLGCVPSQINYVISSRFTPEQGYTVESRRGGGGYIRIYRAKPDYSAPLMHLVNSVGEAIDENTCRAHLYNLTYQKLLAPETASLIMAATANSSYREVPQEYRDRLRAAIFKQMLLTVNRNSN